MDPRKNHDLTQGSLTRGLLSLAGPMLVGAALQNVQSLIESHLISGFDPCNLCTAFCDLDIFSCGEHLIRLTVLKRYKCSHYFCKTGRLHLREQILTIYSFCVFYIEKTCSFIFTKI